MSKVGQITKLIVNIDKCQTRITYKDGSMRFLCANPSGFSFIENYPDHKKIIPARVILDDQRQATVFLRHHFNSENKFLLPQNYDYRDEINFICHTCYTEPTEFPVLQMAKIIEWPWPKEEPLRIFNRFWHLDNCMCRKMAISNEFQKPKCYCMEIKKTMDCINELVNAQDNDNKDQSDSLLSTDLNTKMMSVNGFLKELNDLLVLQAKRNKRQHHRLAKKKYSVCTLEF